MFISAIGIPKQAFPFVSAPHIHKGWSILITNINDRNEDGIHTTKRWQHCIVPLLHDWHHCICNLQYGSTLRKRLSLC